MPAWPKSDDRLRDVEVDHPHRPRRLRHGDRRQRRPVAGSSPKSRSSSGPSSSAVMSPTTATRSRSAHQRRARARPGAPPTSRAATLSACRRSGGRRGGRGRRRRRRPCRRWPRGRSRPSERGREHLRPTRSTASASKRGSTSALAQQRQAGVAVLGQHLRPRRRPRRGRRRSRSRPPDASRASAKAVASSRPTPSPSSAIIRLAAPSLPGGSSAAPPRKLAVDAEDRDRVLLVEPGGDAAGRGHRLDLDLGPGRQRQTDSEEGRRGQRGSRLRPPAAGRPVSQPVTEASGRNTVARGRRTSSGVTACSRSGQAASSSSVSPVASAAPTRRARLSWLSSA